MGFRLVLDDVKLVSSATFSASDSPRLPASELVPVLADDMDELKSGNNRYLMKLKPSTPLDQFSKVCTELSGAVAGIALGQRRLQRNPAPCQGYLSRCVRCIKALLNPWYFTRLGQPMLSGGQLGQTVILPLSGNPADHV